MPTPDAPPESIALIEALLTEGETDRAEAACRSMLAREPASVEALFLLGNCLARQGRWHEAADCFAAACRLAPELAVLWRNQGAARHELGELAAAQNCYHRALALESDHAGAWQSLGTLYVADYAFDQAAACYRRALALGPTDRADLLNRLATLQVYLGETEKALGTFEQAIRAATNLQQRCRYSQNRLFSMHYPATVTPQEIAVAHRQWGDSFFPAKENVCFSNVPTSERRLRIGYVSPDFRMNAVCFFIQPVVKWHDWHSCEVHCYANVKKPDEVTRQLQEIRAIHWRDISSLDDRQASELIRQDRIDILVDLTGHGGDNRLPLFALRPAPLQMTWIGYPDTTGLPAMDYRITDPIADPPGMTEPLHTEQLLRLPGCFLCYNPGVEFPAPSPRPSLAGGGITFGTMSNFSKINPQLIELWALLLQRVPGSRLLLRYRGQERQRIGRMLGTFLEQHGVAGHRLELLGHAASVPDQLAGYHQLDIALDTFPYNGTTTTCEALWMGVPVITLAGGHHAARVGASLLSTVGLSHCIAETPEAYIEKAVALARNLPLLDTLRTRLRGMVAASPLCDHETFTRQLEQLYRRIWRRWCATQGAEK